MTPLASYNEVSDMATFHNCEDCGKEFLGHDDTEKGTGMFCRRCWMNYTECIRCFNIFQFGTSGDKADDLCNDCWEDARPISCKEIYESDEELDPMDNWDKYVCSHCGNNLEVGVDNESGHCWQCRYSEDEQNSLD